VGLWRSSSGLQAVSGGFQAVFRQFSSGFQASDSFTNKIIEIQQVFKLNLTFCKKSIILYYGNKNKKR
jgi:hypothetical protein